MYTDAERRKIISFKKQAEIFPIGNLQQKEKSAIICLFPQLLESAC
jgi:hypothetical protein